MEGSSTNEVAAAAIAQIEKAAKEQAEAAAKKETKLCLFGCGRKVIACGLCVSHYRQALRQRKTECAKCGHVHDTKTEHAMKFAADMLLGEQVYGWKCLKCGHVHRIDLTVLREFRGLVRLPMVIRVEPKTRDSLQRLVDHKRAASMYDATRKALETGVMVLEAIESEMKAKKEAEAKKQNKE